MSSFIVLFLLFANGKTMLQWGRKFLPRITLLCSNPTLALSPGYAGLSRYVWTVPPPLRLGSHQRQPGKSDIFLLGLGTLSLTQLTYATRFSPFLTKVSRLATPTPHSSPRGSHSVFSYVNILIRRDFCFAYSGDFHFLNLKYLCISLLGFIDFNFISFISSSWGPPHGLPHCSFVVSSGPPKTVGESGPPFECSVLLTGHGHRLGYKVGTHSEPVLFFSFLLLFSQVYWDIIGI